MSKEFTYAQLQEKAFELYAKENNIPEGTYITIDDPLTLFKRALEILRQESQNEN